MDSGIWRLGGGLWTVDSRSWSLADGAKAVVSLRVECNCGRWTVNTGVRDEQGRVEVHVCV